MAQWQRSYVAWRKRSSPASLTDFAPKVIAELTQGFSPEFDLSGLQVPLSNNFGEPEQHLPAGHFEMELPPLSGQLRPACLGTPLISFKQLQQWLQTAFNWPLASRPLHVPPIYGREYILMERRLGHWQKEYILRSDMCVSSSDLKVVSTSVERGKSKYFSHCTWKYTMENQNECGIWIISTVEFKSTSHVEIHGENQFHGISSSFTAGE